MKYLILLTLFFAGCRSSVPAPYQEVTGNYYLPPELKGCKIFVLGGQWSATNPLWVIVPPQGLERPLIID